MTAIRDLQGPAQGEKPRAGRGQAAKDAVFTVKILLRAP